MTTNNTKTQTKQNNQTEIGALWKRQSQKGQKYLAGTIKQQDDMGQKIETKIVIFPIDNKSNPNSPDFRIYLSTLPAKGATSESATPTATTVKVSPRGEHPSMRRAEPDAQKTADSEASEFQSGPDEEIL